MAAVTPVGGSGDGVSFAQGQAFVLTGCDPEQHERGHHFFALAAEVSRCSLPLERCSFPASSS